MRNDRVMLFAGTAEGRQLYVYLQEKGIPADVYTATEYGRELLWESRGTKEAAGTSPADGAVQVSGTKEAAGTSSMGWAAPMVAVHAGRLTQVQIEERLHAGLALLGAQGSGTLWVIDATHPYAAEVTENIRSACESVEKELAPTLAGTVSGEVPRGERNGLRLRLLRLLRPAGQEAACRADTWEPEQTPEKGGQKIGKAVCRRQCKRSAALNTAGGPAPEEGPQLVWVRNAAEAASYVEGREGNVFVTTGSKELAAFTAVTDYRLRIYVRLLPFPEAVQKARELGFTGRHLYCMQGPFSQAMNELLLRETDSRYLVTKEAGREGGFPEKLAAAGRVGAVCVVIERPSAEAGYTLEEIERIIMQGCCPAEGREER